MLRIMVTHGKARAILEGMESYSEANTVPIDSVYASIQMDPFNGLVVNFSDPKSDEIEMYGEARPSGN